ncbi:Transcriptional regulator, LysR family (fragment) [Serratia proteamaculans]
MRTHSFFRNKRNMRLTPFGEQGLFYVKNSLNSLHALPDIADRLGKGKSGTLSPAFISVRVTTLFPSWSAIFINLSP